MRKEILACVLISWCITVLAYQNVIECKKPCTCNSVRKSAMCTGTKGIRYIPRLPEFILTVYITRYSFVSVTKDLFVNITKYNTIKNLKLVDNNIHSISVGAFSDFLYLESFECSKEPLVNITQLQQSFGNMKTDRMKYLRFSYNQWERLPSDFFQSFCDIKHPLNVSITANTLQRLNSEVFQVLRSIGRLNLDSNNIKNVTLDSVLNVTEISLNDNRINDIPYWCNNNESLVPNLKVLNLGDNILSEMNETSFDCVQNIEVLNLDRNSFRILESNTFRKLKKLKILRLSGNNRLKVIKDFAFNTTSLKFLNFSQNSFQFKQSNHRYSPKKLFSSCPHLEHLDISHNILPTKNQYTLVRAMFRPLKKMVTLRATSSFIRSLPYYTFSSMKNLEVLDLQGNLIQGWSNGTIVFGANSSLKRLNLRSNLIRFINATTFPPSLLKSLKELDLSFNYFSCTCGQMWFRDWIRSSVESQNKKTNILLKGYPNLYKCKLPGELRGISLRDYNPTIENCKEKNPLIVMAIVFSCFGACGILIVFVLYKCQTNLKNYVYLCRFYKNRRSGYIRLDSDEDYEYHAFIVYCDADRDWVHNVCVKKLEQEEEMKICIHHRDFDIGEPVTGNIEKYMSKCRKIIVVMSNNFAKSEWCQWEVDLVHERRRRQGKNVSLLIMLRTIDSKHMTSRLKALLESTPYITYCKGVGEGVFWKVLIENLRKPFGHPPIAVV